MMRSIFLLFSVLASVEADDHDHGHEEGHGLEAPAEWAGLFDVKDYDTLQWIAQKVDGGYADATMDIVIMEADEDTDEELEHLAETAVPLLDGTCASTPVTPTDTIDIPDGACYELVFDDDSYVSLWTIDVTGMDYIAVYAQHVPIEFEDTTHYLRAPDGTDIEPLHELPEEEEPEKPWGLVIGTTLLVNAVTFSGVALIGCKLIGKSGSISPTAHGGLSGFAAGALIACAVFLILVEAMHLINTEHEEEKETVWRWGASFLAGFLAAPFMFLINPFQILPKDGNHMDTAGKPIVVVDENKKMTTLFAICVGDFMHNLVDGFAIGFAFKMCDATVAWGILFATVYHEIPQEVGDFALLTNDVGLSVVSALAINFLAGTSVVLGGILVTILDITDHTSGIILAIGGGNYVYLAAVEALPRAFSYSELIDDKSQKTVKKHYAVVLASFVLGAVLIGLILINHEHCVPGGGEHAH